MAPLWPDPVSLAALQARALIDAGKATEEDFAAVAARSRQAALANPKAQVAYDRTVDELLAEDYVVAPLRSHALPPVTDGAAAVVLAAGDKAFEWAERSPGLDHRHRPPGRDPRARRPRPHRLAVDGEGRRGPGWRRAGRRGRAARPVRAPGADPGRGARPRDGVTSTRRAGRWPPTR